MTILEVGLAAGSWLVWLFGLALFVCGRRLRGARHEFPDDRSSIAKESLP